MIAAPAPTPLWTAEEAAAATDGTAVGTWSAGNVVIDSRAVATGDLFVALRGPNHDGHDYVAKALKSGELQMACEDPDHPDNWPRNMFVWRSNLLGSSGKGHEQGQQVGKEIRPFDDVVEARRAMAEVTGRRSRT